MDSENFKGREAQQRISRVWEDRAMNFTKPIKFSTLILKTFCKSQTQ
jgi:hypothetical protein